MKHTYIFTALLIITGAISKDIHAQLGDFTLPNNSQRKFVVVAADSTFEGGLLKNLFIGKNYRKEWLQPVAVPVLNMRTDLGGITPLKEGGGKQTQSLQIKDGQGREWVLRSVKKYPEKGTPPEVKGTLGEKIYRDAITASYPYAVLSTGGLAKAANIPYLQNTLVFIPDDAALNEFRDKYKNSLALLEQRSIMATATEEAKTYSTHKLIPELNQTADKQIDQQKLLRARLLDNFIMDFDRHEDQWVWVERDSAGRKFYTPVPKDRDQAFFKLRGILQVASASAPLGPLQGFRAKAKKINTFNHSARDFDRRFLIEPDEQMWSSEVDNFLASMTDAAIENALSRQPKEIHNYRSAEIINSLKERRSHFKKEMMNYYHFLSRIVSVPGSNDSEQFNIDRRDDGSVQVVVQKLSGNGTPEFETYRRVFYPDVTKEVRLYGLENDDQFLITGASSAIKIRLIGGPGNDVFNNTGTGTDIEVNDVSFEENTVTGSGIRNRISNDPMNNEFKQRGFRYNSSAPGLFVELSQEGGLMVGPSLRIVRAGFRKEPYATKHFILATRALKKDYYHFKYDADFIGRKKTDVLFRGDYRQPTVRTNFYGLGNNTTYNINQPESYYRARYSLADLSLLLHHRITSALSVSYGPVAQYLRLSIEKNAGNYVRNLIPVNSGKGSPYQPHWYAGGEVRAELNTKNHQLIPTSGVRSFLYTRPLFGLSNSDEKLNQTGGEFSFYSDFIAKDRIVLASSFGASHIFGDFQFPQAQYLGFRQNLRGYRFQRFAGRSRAYNNTELRINFGDANLYLVRGPIGIYGFHDIARVWVENETSDQWHSGYGGGIWLAPFNKILVAAAITSSKEEKILPQISFGFQF